MILKSVTDKINDLPNLSFHQLFTKFVMEVQDFGIEYEFSRASKYSYNDIETVQELINLIQGEMVRI